jgi:P pilus assembly chaperone PapD
MFFMRSLLFIGSFVIAMPLFAGANLGVSPTTFNLTPSQKTGALTLMNKGDQPVNIQISAKSWDMDENGTFIETETLEFVFFPKIVTIAPHQQENIRIGYHGKFPKFEKSYRLFVDEIAPIIPKEKSKQIAMGLTSLLRLSMPLYVVPVSKIPAPKVVLSALKNEDKALRVGIQNPTAYHLQIQKVSVTLLKQNEVLVEKSVDLKLQRILGNHQLFVKIPMAAKKFCQQADTIEISIKVKNMKEDYKAQFPLKPRCQL